MKMKPLIALFVAALFASAQALAAAELEPGFKALFDGKSFDGWKMAEENQGTWTIEDGALVAHGERCHLFYTGVSKPYRSFHLKVEVMTAPHSNGGIYFHTKYQSNDWPSAGFECQVNNTHSDWIKTGSLYGLVNVAQSAAQDNKWWTEEIIVKGTSVTVLIDGHK